MSGEAQHYFTILGINLLDNLITTTSISIPDNYVLHANYPNPFNPITTIRYDIPDESHITLVIYDVMGREVRQLVDGVINPGYHNAVWDSRNTAGNEIASGVYIYRFTAVPVNSENGFKGINEVRTMLFVK